MSDIKLYNQDCMEAMKEMADNKFDLAIVDPPYGIGDTWSKSRRDRFYKKGKLHQYKNDSIPDQGYFTELLRVSRNQIIWGGNYFTLQLAPTNGWIIWDKKINAETQFMSEAELAWTSFKKVTRIAEFVWNGAVKCERVDKIHPHQKPIALYKWVLKNYAKPGDTILDTHLGSGSIAIACHDMGFDLTGYEIDQDYYEAAMKRLENHQRQGQLFKPEPQQKVEQLSIEE